MKQGSKKVIVLPRVEISTDRSKTPSPSLFRGQMVLKNDSSQKALPMLSRKHPVHIRKSAVNDLVHAGGLARPQHRLHICVTQNSISSRPQKEITRSKSPCEKSLEQVCSSFYLPEGEPSFRTPREPLGPVQLVPSASPEAFGIRQGTTRNRVIERLQREIQRLRQKLEGKHLQIDKLKENILALQKENENLREELSLEKKIEILFGSCDSEFCCSVSEKKPHTEINSFIQTEAEVIKKEAVQARIETSQAKRELALFRNDNAKLQDVILRYRKMLKEASEQNWLNGSEKKEEISSKKDSFVSIEYDTPEKIKSTTRFQHFLLFVEILRKIESYSSIVSRIVKELRTLIHYDKIGVFIFDKSLKVTQGFDMQKDCHCKFHKIYCARTWLDVIYDEAGHSEPSFSTIEQARCGFRTQDHLAIPVLGHRSFSLSMLIQLERRRGEGWRPFCFADEMILRLLCQLLTYRVDFDFFSEEFKKGEEKSSKVVKHLSSLLKAQSKTGLVSAIEELIPAFHSFENAGVIFVPTFETEDLAQEGPFPPTMGICGEIVSNPIIRIPDAKAWAVFNGEIDGVISGKTVRNFLYGPVFQSNGKLVAIIQLINRSGGVEVTSRDITLFERMQTIYGQIIEKVLEKEHIMHILIGLKSSTNHISGILPKEDSTETRELSHLATSMLTVNSLVNDMASVRKNLFVQNSILFFIDKEFYTK